LIFFKEWKVLLDILNYIDIMQGGPHNF